MSQTRTRQYSPIFRREIAEEVVSVIDSEGVPRETACRIVAKRRGMTRFQVRGICVVAKRHGLVDVPARPIHWFSTREIIRLGERMMELRYEGNTVTDAAEIVSREIGCCRQTVECHWRSGLRDGRWQDPVTSRREVEAR